MDEMIPFRPHPVSPILGVLAKFANGYSVLLEPHRRAYEVMDPKGNIYYYPSIGSLCLYLRVNGCFEAGEAKE